MTVLAYHSRRQPISIAREGGGFFDVAEAEHLFEEALDAHAHTAVGRHAVLEGGEVALVVGGVQAARADALDELRVVVNALAAGADFDAAEEQVE